MKRIVIYALTILIISSACKNETDVDPCAKFDEIDREMLDLIKTIQIKHHDNKKFLSNFNMEQVYWINYRDHHLKAIYPEDWSRHYRKDYGKEIFNPCKCKEMIRFTRERIKELTLWLKGGPEEQDECPSLWK